MSEKIARLDETLVQVKEHLKKKEAEMAKQRECLKRATQELYTVSPVIPLILLPVFVLLNNIVDIGSKNTLHVIQNLISLATKLNLLCEVWVHTASLYFKLLSSLAILIFSTPS